jgi:hypothetical protein
MPEERGREERVNKNKKGKSRGRTSLAVIYSKHWRMMHH